MKDCDHQACSCSVADDQEYCSTACETGAADGEELCDCPHEDCEGHDTASTELYAE